MTNPSGAQDQIGAVRFAIVNDGVHYYDVGVTSGWWR